VAAGLVHDNRQNRPIAKQLVPCAPWQNLLLDSVHGNPAPAITADAGGAQVVRIATSEIHRFYPLD
jgi:hypothetical protein